MANAYCVFNNNETLPNSTKTWNEFTASAQTGATLLSDTGTDDGWTITHPALNIYNNLYGALSGFTADAAWCDEPARDPLAVNDGGTYTDFVFSGLDNAKTYTVEAWGAHPSDDRAFNLQVNGGTAVQFIGYDTDTGEMIKDEVARVTGVSPASGDVTVGLKLDSGGTAYIQFLRVIEEVATPEVTLDQANLVPGVAFSGTYSNFGAAPVSPVTLSDTEGNQVTVAVSISDDGGVGGVHSGTYSGTMPALPTSGSTSGILFGTVTLELST